MKLRKIGAVVAATGLALTLAACGSDDTDTTASGTSSSSTTRASEKAQLPTAQELNEVLRRATDDTLPMEERTTSVQGGEAVPPELFDTLTASQRESGAQFQVVDPVLPGLDPTSVLATVNITLPDQEPQVANSVKFVNEGGKWKVSQSWACILVQNTVEPDQVPAMCAEQQVATTPHDDSAAAVEATPSGEQPPAPAVEEAPAPEQIPAPGDAAEQQPAEEAPVQ